MRTSEGDREQRVGERPGALRRSSLGTRPDEPRREQHPWAEKLRPWIDSAWGDLLAGELVSLPVVGRLDQADVIGIAVLAVMFLVAQGITLNGFKRRSRAQVLTVGRWGHRRRCLIQADLGDTVTKSAQVVVSRYGPRGHSVARGPGSGDPDGPFDDSSCPRTPSSAPSRLGTRS